MQNVIEQSKTAMLKQTKTSTAIIPKLPAYGKALADRQRFNNVPRLVVVCIGGDCWNRAKKWQNHTDIASLVLTPDLKPGALQWPVKGCPCMIEWNIAAPESLIIELVKSLLRAGALWVAVTPLWIDYNTLAETFDPINQRWHRERESMRTYYPRNAQKNVA